VSLTKELQTLLYRLLLTMLVDMEVQTAQQYNQEQAVITPTLSVIMLPMHSTTTTRRIQYQLVVYSEEQHRLQAMIQVRISSNLEAKLSSCDHFIGCGHDISNVLRVLQLTNKICIPNFRGFTARVTCRVWHISRTHPIHIPSCIQYLTPVGNFGYRLDS